MAPVTMWPGLFQATAFEEKQRSSNIKPEQVLGTRMGGSPWEIKTLL
jgi:hypothetical protein